LVARWKTTEDRFIADLKIFKATYKSRVNPLSNVTGDFTVLESPDWVNIIALTDDNKIVMVEQYRQGTDSITIEIPGGLIEVNENPLKAARRECLEETGYEGDGEPELIGVSQPNPAFQNNNCYTYVWKNCHKVLNQNLDKHEIINIHLIPLNEIRELILNGNINHSVILTALFYYFLKFGL
jgi:8-oxo-dGTP pyrophosphatase MutT (NUDIX family)